MNASKVLLIVALLLAAVAAVLGFGWLDTTGDPHVVRWLAASFVAYLASLLAA